MHNCFSYIRLLILLLLLFPENSFAQERETGDVTIEDFFQYDQSYDSIASAIVLFDVAKVHFNSRFDVIMNRHTRIKILNESGLDYGDVQLIFNKNFDQRIDKIKAFSYTTKDEQLDKREIHRRDIFEEKLFDNVYAKKFTFPNLEAGSIIDYSYQKVMGNPFYLPDWKFHKEIPVQHSSIYMKIPWRFNYHMVFKGTDTVYTTHSGNYDEGFDKGYFVEISKDSLPPVEDLPFIDSRDDFISEVYTQLSYAYDNSRRRTDYLKDWDQIADEIRNHPDIGKQRTNRRIRQKIEELKSGADSETEILTRIFEFVSTSMVWNRRHQAFSEKGIRDTFDDKSGSSGDMNLLLYKMLEEAGIYVAYGLTSTRGNGLVLTDYPLINQFNHIIVVAEADGQAYYLDASSGNRSLKAPPVKILYQLVYIVQEDSHGWLVIKPLQRTASAETLTYTIDETGKAKASYIKNSIGYIAENFRKKVNSEKNTFEASKSLLSGLENSSLDTVVVRGTEATDNTTVHFMEFSFDAFGGDSLRDVNYFEPLLFIADKENLLVRPTREFPVYFPFPVRETKNVNIKIPKGYQVDEAPNPELVVLENNKGKFSFNVEATDSTVIISSDFSINESFFGTDEYKQLREMFIKLSDAHSRTVVIKRKE